MRTRLSSIHGGRLPPYRRDRTIARALNAMRPHIAEAAHMLARMAVVAAPAQPNSSKLRTLFAAANQLGATSIATALKKAHSRKQIPQKSITSQVGVALRPVFGS